MESRAAKDAEHKPVSAMNPMEVEAKLREKAEKYESLVRGGRQEAREGAERYMVDFEQKRWETKKEASGREDAGERMNEQWEQMDRERRDWEVQAR